MRLPLSGGCQCGRVRYQIRAEPLAVYVCHCTECQRQSGSAFALSLAVARDLALVGYDIGSSEPADPALRLALVAFQRHWRQRLWDGVPDRESAAHLAGLCALIG